MTFDEVTLFWLLLLAWPPLTALAILRHSPLIMWGAAITSLTVGLGFWLAPLALPGLVQFVVGLVWFFTIDWDERFPPTVKAQRPATPASKADDSEPREDPENVTLG